MTGIWVAALALGGLGLVFGVVLALVGKKFAVKEDPKKLEVRALLPGANCGGCGFAGCDAYAEAVADGTSPVNLCPVGGDRVAAEIARVMGVQAEAQARMVATVKCRGATDKCGLRFEYEGPKTCKNAALVAGGDKACRFACLGYGDCEAHCPFGAIHVVENRIAEVIADRCHGCGVCVASCPREVIKLLPLRHPVHRTCSAMDRGKAIREHCTSGCIGCGKCERACKFGALSMQNNLPQINQTLCKGCMECADNCPTGALKANETLRRHALIDYSHCVGCGMCQKVCQFEAIMGEKGHHHSVIDWNCTGCGECERACHLRCIRMVPGAKYKP